MAPALFLLLAFFAGPILWTVWASLTNAALTGAQAAQTEFVGLDNFTKLLSDPRFRTATVLTVLSRLEKKAMVQRERSSRPHRYSATASREEHTVEMLNEVLGTAPDREAVLARFIGGVSEAEAASLRRILSN